MSRKGNSTVSSTLCWPLTQVSQKGQNSGLPNLCHLVMWLEFLAGSLPPCLRQSGTALSQKVPQQTEMNAQKARKGHPDDPIMWTLSILKRQDAMAGLCYLISYITSLNPFSHIQNGNYNPSSIYLTIVIKCGSVKMFHKM